MMWSRERGAAARGAATLVVLASLLAVAAADHVPQTSHTMALRTSAAALDAPSCFSCQVLFNDTARVLTDGAAAATRKALQQGLRIPEGGRLLNPPFTTTLDAGINCPRPPEACMTFSMDLAHVWTNAFMFVNSDPASAASAWANTLMQDTSRWMKDGASRGTPALDGHGWASATLSQQYCSVVH